jgi:hypothetical protein
LNPFDDLTPEDFRWLGLVKEGEHARKRMRPLPAPVQSRLRSFQLIELKHGRYVLTREGERVYIEHRRRN